MTLAEFKEQIIRLETVAALQIEDGKKKDRKVHNALANAFQTVSALADAIEPDQIQVECNVFDICEEHHNCHVTILRNSITGETSFAWEPEDDE